MNSNLFNMLGLNIDIAYILIFLLVIIIVLIVMLALQSKKIKGIEEQIEKFMRGKDAASLENEIVELFEDNDFIKKETEKNRKSINDLYNRIAYCFQKIGIVKYDAFNQMGGQLSYSLALLDEDNNGFILNSVHSYDGNYTYSKVVKEGKCDIELGEEEQQALDEAMNYFS